MSRLCIVFGIISIIAMSFDGNRLSSAQTQLRLVPESYEWFDRNFGYQIVLNNDQFLVSSVAGSYNKLTKFIVEDGEWVPSQELLLPLATSVNTIDLSARINWLFVGSPFSVDFLSGAVYFYENIDDQWILKGPILPDDIPASELFPRGYIDFGSSVVADGNILVASAPRYYHPYDYELADSSGSVYVFSYDGAEWEQVARLKARDGVPFDDFGRSIGVSGDWIAIDAPGDTTMGPGAGAIHLYNFDSNTDRWVHHKKLYSPFHSQRKSFSLAGFSGTSIIAVDAASTSEIGGISPTLNPHHFEYENGDWVWKGEIYPDSSHGSPRNGVNVFIKNDRLFISAPDAIVLEDQGSVKAGGFNYFEKNSNKKWEFKNTLKPRRVFRDEVFDGHHMDFDDSRVIIGQPSWEDSTGQSVGAVYLISNDAFYTSKEIFGIRDKRNISLSVSPNPFSTIFNVGYDVSRVSQVTISVYDVLGRRVAIPVSEVIHAPGRYEESFDGAFLSQGVYVLVLDVNGSERQSSIFIRM